MYITSDDARLYTVGFGPGPQTILALGGWAGSWEVWAEPFGLLSRKWRTVAFDHRGSGATIAPLDSITAENMVADVFAVMDALGVERCVLAAESAGATIALLAALEWPERFSALVIVDGLIHHPPDNHANPFLQGLKSDFEATIADFVEQCAPGPELEAIRYWGRQILRRSGPQAGVRLLESMEGIDLRPNVVGLRVPAVIIHGEADTIVPLSDAQDMADILTNGNVYVIQGAGHIPTMTHAAEVAAIIDQAFITGSDVESD
jgi:pimeloyl-ACP methyl ester carboxylesterase